MEILAEFVKQCCSRRMRDFSLRLEPVKGRACSLSPNAESENNKPGIPVVRPANFYG